jgi:hypothetical protein
MLSIRDKNIKDKGIKIAKIKGGKDDKKYIYLDVNFDVYSEKNLCEALKKINCGCDNKKNGECPKIKDAILKHIEPTNQEEKEKYYIVMKELINLSFNELHISGGKIQPIPRKDIIEKIYISAPSGAGKSTWCGKYIGEFLKMFKDDELYVFSTIEEDKVLDKHDPIRITLDDSIIDDPICPEEIENSLCIFDDIDTIRNLKVRQSICGLRDWLLEQGRHFNVRMLSTSHILMNYKKTQRLLNEATAVVFFPKASSAYHIKRYLKVYAGLDVKQIRKIMNLPSRWVALYRTYPMYVMYEKGIYLLCNENE